MLKAKGFGKPSYIIHHRQNQLGNTLIPVIIALSISAVASVAFLKQGSNLSAQAKALEAQYELADVLQQWNKIKVSKDIVNITSSDLPSVASVDGLDFYAGIARTNATVATASTGPSTRGFGLGGTNLFDMTPSLASAKNYARLVYGPLNSSLCESLKNTFNDDMVGIFDSDCSYSSSAADLYLVIHTN